MPTGIYKRIKKRGGWKLSKEDCQKISKRMKAEYASGKRVSCSKGKKLSETIKKRMTKSLKNDYASGKRISYWKGKKHSKETKIKISKAMKGGNSTSFKKGHKMSDVVREKTSETMKGIMPKNIKQIAGWNKGLYGEGNPNWQNGKSFEPYPIEFNNRLKKQIRERDNHICQECGYTEKQLGYKLHIHHIDYDKRNCNLNNLISLCRSCHTQTNYKRKDWTKYYKQKLATA